MNPEHFDNLKSSYTVWTLIDSDGNTVLFKVPHNGDAVTITQESGGSFMTNKDDARKHWNRYMENGYRISNKSINYDMDEFHKMKRLEEYENSKYEVAAKAAAAEYMEDIAKVHENDLMEMRINPKDFFGYRNPLMECTNYALEA